MTSAGLAGRMALATGAAALVGMGMLTACSTKEKPAGNSPASSSPSATARVSPIEKSVPGALTPGPNAGAGGQNSFSPTAKAGQAPTALPGNVNTGG